MNVLERGGIADEIRQDEFPAAILPRSIGMCPHRNRPIAKERLREGPPPAERLPRKKAARARRTSPLQPSEELHRLPLEEPSALTGFLQVYPIQPDSSSPGPPGVAGIYILSCEKQHRPISCTLIRHQYTPIKSAEGIASCRVLFPSLCKLERTSPRTRLCDSPPSRLALSRQRKHPVDHAWASRAAAAACAFRQVVARTNDGKNGRVYAVSC